MIESLRERARELDRTDELARCRDRFSLPRDMIYLSGNSLGAMPARMEQRLSRAVTEEWANGLVKSWNSAGWIELPRLAAARVARLIGASAEEVAVTDSTSVNLFKLLSAALRMRPGRRRIISERDNFPTDLYIADGLIRLLDEEHELVLAESPEEIEGLIDERTAVLMLSHVNYRTGYMHDMAALTKRAQDAGALALWDLAHSAGAVEVDLTGANADFAIGCGYKYLNGGPGAPAFLYVADRHQQEARQPLTGWFSHREPFAFNPAYEPAEGIAKFHIGTPPILSLIALHEALDVWRDVDMAAVRRKSLALTSLFIDAIDALCPGLTVITPREPEKRGSQVCVSVGPDGYPIMRALIASNIVGDFRAPDMIRFGFTPLYLRHADALRAAEVLSEIIEKRLWDRPEFHMRERVT